MRMKKAIDRLSARAVTVDFPKADTTFLRFQEDLIEVLLDNGLDNDWDFDEESQTFYTTWERLVDATHIGLGATIYRHVTLDPRKPLAEEITRLLDEQARMNRQALQVAVAIAALPAEVPHAKA